MKLLKYEETSIAGSDSVKIMIASLENCTMIKNSDISFWCNEQIQR